MVEFALDVVFEVVGFVWVGVVVDDEDGGVG